MPTLPTLNPIAARLIGGADAALLWLLRNQRWLWIAAAIALPTIAIGTWANVTQRSLELAHDEAQHLHILFAIARGEVPYRDFVENHPALLHVLLLGLKVLFNLASESEVLTLGRLLVAAHFAGSIAIACWAIDYCMPSSRPRIHVALAVCVALAMTNIWAHTAPAGAWRMVMLWQLRPDWLSYFYAALAVALHFRWLSAAASGERRVSSVDLLLLAVGATSAGLAMALLAKASYLFIPYIFTLILVGMQMLQSGEYRARLRYLFVGNAVFAAFALIAFAGFVAVELAVTKASPREYWLANYALNAIKHMTPAAADFNPFNMLRSLFGLSGVEAAVMLLVSVATVQAMASAPLSRCTALVLYAFLMIVSNMALPAFTNGLTWPQYFMPSLLAWVLLVGPALYAGTDEALLARAASSARTRAVLAAAFLWIFVSLIGRFDTARAALDEVRHFVSMRSAAGLAERDLTSADKHLPRDLRYLTFSPTKKPVNAPAWSYFFMLVPDQGLWQDNFKLGIGPDPATHWRRLFQSDPPDVITLSSLSDYELRMVMLRGMQQVEIGWLRSEIEANYLCQVRLNLVVQVRRDLAESFALRGWRPCIFSAETARD